MGSSNSLARSDSVRSKLSRSLTVVDTGVERVAEECDNDVKRLGEGAESAVLFLCRSIQPSSFRHKYVLHHHSTRVPPHCGPLPSVSLLYSLSSFMHSLSPPVSYCLRSRYLLRPSTRCSSSLVSSCLASSLSPFSTLYLSCSSHQCRRCVTSVLTVPFLRPSHSSPHRFLLPTVPPTANLSSALPPHCYQHCSYIRPCCLHSPLALHCTKPPLYLLYLCTSSPTRALVPVLVICFTLLSHPHLSL
jgi:hypothetical protein